MMNENLDLTISRVIQAPRSAVWTAWKDPAHFVKWWTPAPVVTTSVQHEFYAGGAFETKMKLADGTDIDCGEGCFIDVVENERIIFTDALAGGYRPNTESFMTAIITLEDHRDGTLYTATALHKNMEDCQKHADMGFMDGWGTALAQLAGVAEGLG